MDLFGYKREKNLRVDAKQVAIFMEAGNLGPSETPAR